MLRPASVELQNAMHRELGAAVARAEQLLVELRLTERVIEPTHLTHPGRQAAKRRELRELHRRIAILGVVLVLDELADGDDS